MAKYVQAPNPRDSTYCRWCDSGWTLFRGCLMCEHCDLSCEVQECDVCAVVNSRTDDRKEAA